MYWNFDISKDSPSWFWLTLTWDLLKYVSLYWLFSTLSRLTLTWDVLKWCYINNNSFVLLRLTLTWDVLKYSTLVKSQSNTTLININMRCIEMQYWDYQPQKQTGLTLTWDVLK